MTKRTLERLFYLGVGVLLLLGVGFAICVAAGFRESVDCRRGSFNFWLGISEPVIKTFPTPGLVSEPQYHWGCGDGPKLPDQSISFLSRLPAAELRLLAQNHIIAHDYARDMDLPGFTYVTGSGTLYLRLLSAGEGITQVNAEVLFH